MIRPRLTLAVVAVAGALAGCTLGPDYVRPEAQIQLPAQYAAAPLAASPAIASNCHCAACISARARASMLASAESATFTRLPVAS